MDASAFSNSGLTSIKLPSTLKKLGAGALANTNIESIELPDGLTYIGDSAINVNTITEIELPDSVEYLGDNCLPYSEGLTELTLPKNLKHLGALHLGYVTSIALPEGFTEIPEGAFDGWRSLASIDIPDTVTRIGNDAFYGCEGLYSVDIPDSVTSLGKNAFRACTNLSSVTLPKYIDEIPEGCFAQTMLEDVVIPEGVEEIGNSAFAGCGALVHVTLPETLYEIGDRAFDRCPLAELVIPDSVDTIGTYAFGITYSIGGYIFAACSRYSAYSYASGHVDSLTVVCSSDSVAASYVFEHGLSYRFTDTGEYQDNMEDYLTYTELEDGTLEVTGHKEGMNADHVVVPATHDGKTVTSIGDYALSGGYRTVVLPDTIKNLGIYSLADNYITEIDLPDGLESIGYGAFSNTYLKEISLPDSVKLDETGKTVVYNQTYGFTRPYNSYWFSHCTWLRKVKLPAGIKEIPEGTFSGCVTLCNIEIPNTVEKIGDYAFSGVFRSNDTLETEYRRNGNGDPDRKPLTKLVIPDSVKEIGKYAFCECDSLEEIQFSRNLETINENAFSGCNSLKSIEIPGSVKYFTGFNGCSNLESVTIHDGVETIGRDAFDETKLTSITVPRSVKALEPFSLGYYGNYWSYLKDVYIYSDDAEFLADERYSWQIPIDDGLADQVTIHGFKGSTAEEYANRYGFTFEELAVPADEPLIKVRNRSVSAGDTFTLDISIKNNPGLISFMLNVDYYNGDRIQLISAERVDWKGVAFGPTEAVPFVISWADAISGNNTSEEVIARLTFKVNESAPNGEYLIKVSAVEKNTFNAADECIPIWSGISKIDVTELPVTHIPCDIDDDGELTMHDLTTLQKYYNGWDVFVNKYALDVNGDGVFNLKDLTRLQQYLNGWPVEVW